MSEFVPIAKVADFPDPSQQMFEINERIIVLIHVAGSFYCLDDICTHDGGPLVDGRLCGEEFAIACPRHGAKFDIRTGKALSMPATEDSVAHEVKVEHGQVFVKLRAE